MARPLPGAAGSCIMDGGEPSARSWAISRDGRSPRLDQEAASGFAAVLAAARQGEPWALTTLFRELQPRLLRFLRARDASQAEDLASEVWLDVAGGLATFSGSEEGFRAWLFTIARRRLIDARRRAWRRPSDPYPTDRFHDDASPSDTAEQAIGSITAQDAVDRIAAMLPPDQADVVLLRVLGGLSVERVAEMLGKQPGAVRALQHRALRRMSRQLTPDAHGSPEALWTR